MAAGVAQAFRKLDLVVALGVERHNDRALRLRQTGERRLRDETIFTFLQSVTAGLQLVRFEGVEGLRNGLCAVEHEFLDLAQRHLQPLGNLRHRRFAMMLAHDRVVRFFVTAF